MDCASLPDLDSLDVESLKALAIRHQAEIAAQRAEIAARDAEIEQQRQALSDEIEQLRRSSSEQIEHLKLVIEKLRRRVFGVKSEKIVIQLEQLELHLEELESSRAEMEAAVERVIPAAEPKTRSRRKPLPEHLPREVVTHAFQGHCCPDCGGQLRQFGEDVSDGAQRIRRCNVGADSSKSFEVPVVALGRRTALRSKKGPRRHRDPLRLGISYSFIAPDSPCPSVDLPCAVRGHAQTRRRCQ
jgi:hypothetical protein